MVGLIVSGAMLPVAVKEFRAADRTVTVKGLCEKEVPADKVIWPIQFKVVGNDLASLNSSIESKTATVTKFLKNGGFSEADYSISVPIVNDKDASEYGGNNRVYRYLATCTVTVCTKDVNKALALINDQSELIKAGIAPENSWDCQTQFFFEGLNDIKPEMIQEATKNAREVAEKFAADSQSKLGKIKTANQGTFSISDRDSFTPQVKNVRVVTNVVYYLNN